MIEIKYDGKIRQIERSRVSVLRLIELLGLLPEAAIVIRNGEIATEDDVLLAGDEVQVIRPISGGSH
ncbi:MAG: MoaD/ThiS family protein [Candidatus Omnitrophica bacterium]|nr:MoaD/ThiS family protein [Candidatus Omnitrophota bacterium]